MVSNLQQSSEEVLSIKNKPLRLIESNWFIFYTFPRAEKVIYKELVKRNYNVFLPVKKTLRVWKNRQKKWIEQVLFPGYIFVNTQQCELYNISKIPKVVNYLHCAGKPSVIPLKEIEGIKKMLSLNQEVKVETSYYEGERVLIVYGPLAGHEGILIKQKGKTRFGIKLKEINHIVLIDICTEFLEKLS